jgi:hypothetical protein
MYRQADAWAGYVWHCQINGAPAGTAGDLVATLTVNNGGAAATIYDGMTVFVGSTLGAHDRGIFYVRSNQNVGAATNTLLIGANAEVVDNIQGNDWVVVLNEFRVWRRDPRITEAGGVLSWFKEFNLTYASLGANAAQRQEASLPPVAIMGPHRVVFLDPGSSADLTFDWSSSYATYPGATVNDWDAWGEDGGAGWNVNNDATPPAQTYSNVSGLAGYRVLLEVGQDVQDPPARFRRGVRFVFTLRRPGETQAGDPLHAEPITDFEVQSVAGSFEQGFWRATLRISGEQAHEYEITEGALVILFAEDWYGGAHRSLGPVAEVENVLFVGRVADGSIREDSETGDLTFDALSAAEVATRRESYPIAVEHNDNADEWYKVPSLTVDRAAWHYLVWHSTIPLVCDYYWSGTSYEIAAQDFVAGSLYQTVDTFYWERIFGRLLCDRYERFATRVDRQMLAAGAGTTIWALQDDDWIGQVDLREVMEPPMSAADLAGVHYNGAQNDAYMSRAPGDTSLQYGTPQQATYLSIAGQGELNTLAGRLLAYKNNRWPSLSLGLAGNWRVADIWPQEYVSVTLDTVRHAFSSDLFIVREVAFSYMAAEGVLGVSVRLEYETEGIDGKTVTIPEDPPTFSPSRPRYGPFVPAWPGTDGGRRIVATNVGVFATNDIRRPNPRWYDCNAGIPAGRERCWKIFRDPWHWWTTGGAQRTLWGIFADDTVVPQGYPRYLYRMTGFPGGTWAEMLDSEDYNFVPQPAWEHYLPDVVGTIERADCLYAVIQHHVAGLDASDGWFIASYDGGASWTAGELITVAGNRSGYATYPGSNFRLGLANHSAASTICVLQGRALNLSLYKSTDGGGSWGETLPPVGWAVTQWNNGITVPYDSPTWNDRDVILRVGDAPADPTALQRSTDGGVSFADMGENIAAQGYRAHSVPSSDRNACAVLLSSAFVSQIRVTYDGGTTWTQWAAMPWEAGYAAQFDWAEGSGGNGAALMSVTVPRLTNGFEGVFWVTAGGTVSDRTGNLRGYGVQDFSKVERDTVGAA